MSEFINFDGQPHDNDPSASETDGLNTLFYEEADATQPALYPIPERCQGCPDHSAVIGNIGELEKKIRVFTEYLFEIAQDRDNHVKFEDAIEHVKVSPDKKGHLIMSDYPLSDEHSKPTVEILSTDSAEELHDRVLTWAHEILSSLEQDRDRLIAISKKAAQSCFGMANLSGTIVRFRDSETERVRHFATMTCTAAPNSWGDTVTFDNNTRPSVTVVLTDEKVQELGLSLD